jgi:hypothetical protein
VRERFPDLYDRVQKEIYKNDPDEGECKTLYREIAGLKRPPSKGGRPQKYQQALGLTKHLRLRHAKWPVVYNQCKKSKLIDPKMTFPTFKRRMLTLLAAEKSCKKG